MTTIANDCKKATKRWVHDPYKPSTPSSRRSSFVSDSGASFASVRSNDSVSAGFPPELALRTLKDRSEWLRVGNGFGEEHWLDLGEVLPTAAVTEYLKDPEHTGVLCRSFARGSCPDGRYCECVHTWTSGQVRAVLRFFDQAIENAVCDSRWFDKLA